MLLEGAIRFGRQAQQLWASEGQRAECDRLFGRLLDIVEELVRSVAGSEVETAKRLEEEYAFIFRQLAMTQVNRDADVLEGALALLAFQRETWKLACEQLKQCDPSGPPIPAPNFRQPAPTLAGGIGAPIAGGFSLEA